MNYQNQKVNQISIILVYILKREEIHKGRKPRPQPSLQGKLKPRTKGWSVGWSSPIFQKSFFNLCFFLALDYRLLPRERPNQWNNISA